MCPTQEVSKYTFLRMERRTLSNIYLSVDRIHVAARSLPSATAITAESATKMTENLHIILERLWWTGRNSTLVPLMYFIRDIWHRIPFAPAKAEYTLFCRHEPDLPPAAVLVFRKASAGSMLEAGTWVLAGV